MKYYLMKEAVRTEDTGNAYPQIQEMSRVHNFDSDNDVYVFERMDFPPEPDLKYFLLDHQANLTDVLSTAMLRLSGFLINEKVKSVIQQFSLPNHKFYNAYVKAGEEVFHYYWLQISISYQDNSYLNFQGSEFKVERSLLKKESIQITSEKHYNEENKLLPPGKAIRAVQAKLTESFLNKNLDIFKLPIVSTDWFISERLKEALYKSKVTGIEIQNAKCIII